MRVYSTYLKRRDRGGGLLTAPGLPALEIASPPEFGGEPGNWTPEEMLVGAAEACTMLTFLAEAKREGVRVLGYASVARGTLSAGDDGALRFTGVAIEPRIEVASEHDAVRTRAILARVRGQCFIGASLRTEPRIDATVLATGG